MLVHNTQQFYDDPTGAYEWACPYCCAKLKGGHSTLSKGVSMDDLRHDHDCAYIIAKGLKIKNIGEQNGEQNG